MFGLTCWRAAVAADYPRARAAYTAIARRCRSGRHLAEFGVEASRGVLEAKKGMRLAEASANRAKTEPPASKFRFSGGRSAARAKKLSLASAPRHSGSKIWVVSLSDGCKQAIMRALVNMVHDPVVRHILEVETASSVAIVGVDNPLILQIVQAFEDQLLNSLDQIAESATVPDVLVEWAGEAAQTVLDTGPGFSLDWIHAVAKTRVCLDRTAQQIGSGDQRIVSLPRGHVPEPLSLAILKLLTTGVREGHGRSLQVYFLKSLLSSSMPIVGITRGVMDAEAAAQTPLLAFPAIRDDIVAELVPRTSSIKPEIDPFVGMERLAVRGGSKVVKMFPKDYSNMSKAVAKGVVAGAFDELWSLPGLEDSKLKGRPGLDFPCLVQATFQHIYSVNSEHTPIEQGILGAFSAYSARLEWRAESSQVQIGKQILEQIVCASFPKGCYFDLLSGVEAEVVEEAEPVPAWVLAGPEAETTSEDALVIRAVFHLAAVLCTVDPNVSPFFGLLTDAEKHKEQFLPSMPDDEFAEILKTQGDVGIYKCPNGHPYVVGECTRTGAAGVCECGAPIGNARHRGGHTIADGNTLWGYTSKTRVGQGGLVNTKGSRIAGGEDLSKTVPDAVNGYVANGADTEDKTFSARQLTPPYTRVVRFCLHAVLYLAHTVDFPGGAAKSVEGLLGDRLSVDKDFLLKHLKNDWNLLKHLLSCNGETVSIALHLMFNNFQAAATSGSPAISAADGQSFGTLPSAEAREKFERFFKNEVIHPVLSGLAGHVRQVKSSIDDDASGLKAQISEYSFGQGDRNCTTPLLLRLRKPATMEVFAHHFHLRPELGDEFPLLSLFLDKQESICVHKHCGGLFQFLRLVSNRFNKHIDRTAAEEMTVAEAVASADKHVSHEWETAWSDFEASWNSIRSHVKQYECHEIEVPAINSTTPLSIAMPSQRPEYPNSVYCLAVLRWFIRTHNEIML